MHVVPGCRVVVVFLVAFGLPRPGQLENISCDELFDVTDAKIDMPGLGVRPAWRALGDLENLVEGLSRHRIRLEGPDGFSLQDRVQYVHLINFL